MKRLSRVFQPRVSPPRAPHPAPAPATTTANTNTNTSTSQRLLAECGLVRPTTSGCFALLPLAMRSLHKLEVLVRDALESAGAQRISLPTLASAALWDKTGRFQLIRPELFTLQDRHERAYLLSPTHEEVVTELLAELAPISHKQLPLTLYQISSKYRDEKRPRHGLLRAREFLMADGYSFHATAECAAHTYQQVTCAFTHLLRRLAVPYHRVEAESGAMGGSVSHEWQYEAGAGEDILLRCGACQHVAHLATNTPAAAVPGSCSRCRNTIGNHHIQGIEVAHTFILGTRYTAALGALVGNPGVDASAAPRAPVPAVMACYGVGVTRLLAAGVEVLSMPDKIRWPQHLSPYTAIVIGPKEGSREWGGAEGVGGAQAEELARQLEQLPGLREDVLLDDRHNLTVGRRLFDADRMGYRLAVVAGRAGLELHGPGLARRDFRSMPDLVAAIHQLLEEENYSFNVIEQ